LRSQAVAEMFLTLSEGVGSGGWFGGLWFDILGFFLKFKDFITLNNFCCEKKRNFDGERSPN
jgi:hypothetical protein